MSSIAHNPKPLQDALSLEKQSKASIRGHEKRLHLCHGLPVVKDTLREGLARGGSTEGAGETKGLNDRQVGLQVEDGGSRPLCLLKDVATLLVEHRVDTAQRLQKPESIVSSHFVKSTGCSHSRCPSGLQANQSRSPS